MSKDRGLIEEIVRINKDTVSFHVPGHKNGSIIDEDSILKSSASIDITEIEDADNLFDASGIIKAAQNRARDYYNTLRTYFLVNGTTSGILSMITATTKPGDRVLVQRNCHKSVINGIILGDLTPIYLYPEYDMDTTIDKGLSPLKLESILIKHSDIKCVILTYPSYYGICSDIKALVGIAHKYDKIVLIDGAHEAHFKLSKKLPMSALEAGADVVVHSTHKTLPAFTQASMLHINSNIIDIDRLELMLSIYQSSSPSYVLMSSLDKAIDIIRSKGSKCMEELIENVEAFKEKATKITGVSIVDREIVNGVNVKNFDPTKILLSIDGFTGKELTDYLKDNGIHIELYNVDTVLLLCTIGNTKKDFDYLYDCICKIEEGMKSSNLVKETVKRRLTIEPRVVINPRTALYEESEEVLFIDSVKRVCAEYITPYPPGIPLVCPGEQITLELIDCVMDLKARGINIIGPSDTSLEKIKVLIER